jgi:predicted metal-binding protein
LEECVESDAENLRGEGGIHVNQISKVSTDMNQGLLVAHVKTYEATALELGATKSTIIRVDSIHVDERVTLKCQIPRCFGYGAGAHCPPNTLKPAELRDHLKKYEYAILFSLEVPPEVIVRDKATIKERVAAYQTVYKIVSKLESMAFYDGHYLAFGLGAGSCRHTFCGLQETCAAMEGKKCRFSLLARPSMEAVGIDVFKLVASVGWDIYPVGSGANPGNVPKGTLVGIVIVQ